MSDTELHNSIMRDFVDSTAEFNRKEFGPKHDEFPAIFFLLALHPSDGDETQVDVVYVPCDFSDDKRAFLEGACHAIREARPDINIFGLALQSEAWGLECEDIDEVKKVLEENGSVTNSPNRVEVFTIVGVTRDAEHMVTFRMVRPPDGGIMLVDRKESDESGVNLLEGLFKIIDLQI